jgi:quercetin dioxygenase-like cupin family protein
MQYCNRPWGARGRSFGEFRLISLTTGASARAGNVSKTASTNREESMRHFLAITSAFTLAVLVGGQAVAQQPPAQPITRTVVAATKLPTVTDRPLLFRALSVTIPPGEKSSVSTANGILYQMSGSTEASIGGEAKALSPGDGLFLAEGTPASLKAGTVEASRLLHFLLVPVEDQDQPVETNLPL